MTTIVIIPYPHHYSHDTLRWFPFMLIITLPNHNLNSLVPPYSDPPTVVPSMGQSVMGEDPVVNLVNRLPVITN